MKMRISGFLVFALLSLSIFSYGFSSSVFADSHNIPPISAKTELPSYENGDRVYVDGFIRDFDPDIHSNTALTYRLMDTSGNIYSIILWSNKGRNKHALHRWNFRAIITWTK
jgi:hypothetical protein